MVGESESLVVKWGLSGSARTLRPFRERRSASIEGFCQEKRRSASAKARSAASNSPKTRNAFAREAKALA
jgi:hypothetical protein